MKNDPNIAYHMNYGVPQGSILGPLLFLIYINDFRLCLSKTSCGHFADDTFILYNSKKPKTIETVINTELKDIRSKYFYFLDNANEVEAILNKGEIQASILAEKKLVDIRSKIGIKPLDEK